MHTIEYSALAIAETPDRVCLDRRAFTISRRTINGRMHLRNPRQF